MDVQFLFSEQSQFFQRKYESIIGGLKAKTILKRGLENLKIENGPELKKFLENCHCVRSKIAANRIIAVELQYQQFDDRCKNLEEFESMIVVYKNHIIEKNNLVMHQSGRTKKKYDPLSSFKNDYLDMIITNLDSYIPEEMLNAFTIFDNQNWGSKIPIQPDAETKLKSLSHYYGIEYEDAIFQGGCRDGDDTNHYIFLHPSWKCASSYFLI